jgi:hypothetical protein
MLSVTCKPYMLSVILLNGIMLSVVVPYSGHLCHLFLQLWQVVRGKRQPTPVPGFEPMV